MKCRWADGEDRTAETGSHGTESRCRGRAVSTFAAPDDTLLAYTDHRAGPNPGVPARRADARLGPPGRAGWTLPVVAYRDYADSRQPRLRRPEAFDRLSREARLRTDKKTFVNIDRWR
ncbi:hypothetical protein GCM10017556_41180 [Micromonospora sagamiensis]|nr:hypothetical protein GCM10017556_41180 [Micromonospora sagamiensis]